jgi:hypothetical protein
MRMHKWGDNSTANHTHPKITQLKELAGSLSAKDITFAYSLINQFTKKGELSDKQWPYVDMLIDKVETKGVPDFTKGAKNETETRSH